MNVLKTIAIVWAILLAGCSKMGETNPVIPDLSGKPCPAIIGVWPSWSDVSYVDEAVIEKLSHLALVFALPKANGELDTKAIDQVLTHLKPIAKKADVKLVLSIGGAVGYGDAFIKLSANPEARGRFVVNVTKYVLDNGFSGVDIDWEVWTRQAVIGLGGNDPVESLMLLTLIQDLRSTLPPDITLSADIFAGSYYGPQYLPELQDYTDFINLMAFDFTGQWKDSPIRHHADVKTFRRALQDVNERGFRTENLMIGLPAYGVRFENGQTESVTKVPNREIAKAAGNEFQKALSKGRIGDTYFETPEMTEAKVINGLSAGAAGFFLFDISQDHTDPEWSILQTIYKTVNMTDCD